MKQPTHSHAAVMKERAGYRRQIARLTRANAELAERMAQALQANDARHDADAGRIDFWRAEADRYKGKYEGLLKIPEPDRPGSNMSMRVERDIRMSRDLLLMKVDREEDSHDPKQRAIIAYEIGFAQAIEMASRQVAHDPALNALIVRLSPEFER